MNTTDLKLSFLSQKLMSINKSIFEHTWKASRFHFWNLTFLYPRKKHLIWQFHGYETQIRNTLEGDTNAKFLNKRLAIFSKQIAFCTNWYQIGSLELSHFFIPERTIFPIEKRRNENDRTTTRGGDRVAKFLSDQTENRFEINDFWSAKCHMWNSLNLRPVICCSHFPC